MTQKYVNMNNYSLDSDETRYYREQLTNNLEEVFETTYPGITFRTLFPVTSDDSPGAKFWQYRINRRIGRATFIENYADNVEILRRVGEIYRGSYKDIGIAFEHTIQGIRASIQAGENIDADKQKDAKEHIDRKLDEIAYVGSPENEIYGVLSHPSIQKTATSAPLSGLTGQQMFDEIAAMIDAVPGNTNDVEVADVVAFTTDTYNLINRTPLDAATDKRWSVLNQLQDKFPNIRAWTTTPMMKGSYRPDISTHTEFNGVDLAMCFRYDPRVFKIEIPIPYDELDPQPVNYAVLVNALARTAGAKVFRPLAISVLYDV